MHAVDKLFKNTVTRGDPPPEIFIYLLMQCQTDTRYNYVTEYTVKQIQDLIM